MAWLLIITMLFFSSTGLLQATQRTETPIGKTELVSMLAAGPMMMGTVSSSKRLAILVEKNGISFAPQKAFLQTLQKDGAEDSLLKALRAAKQVESGQDNTGANSAETSVLDHLNRAAQLNRNNFHPRRAEPEFKAAVKADPSNPYARWALGMILLDLNKTHAAKSEFHAALKLQPNFAEAHDAIGNLLTRHRSGEKKGIAELKKAVELEPHDPKIQYDYASALLSVKGGKNEGNELTKLYDKLAAALPMRTGMGGEAMGKRLVYAPQPRYPRQAKAKGIQGTVKMKVLVGRNGEVKDWKILSGDSRLAPAAEQAVSKQRYRPVHVGGNAVQVVTEVDVRFSL